MRAFSYMSPLSSLSLSNVRRLSLNNHSLADDWTKTWKISDWKKASGEQGEWVHTAGKWYADEADKGIQTSPDARFHNAWAAMEKSFSTEGKDLVLQVRTTFLPLCLLLLTQKSFHLHSPDKLAWMQFQVKHEQSLDCGGGYIKLIPASR